MFPDAVARREAGLTGSRRLAAGAVACLALTLAGAIFSRGQWTRLPESAHGPWRLVAADGCAGRLRPLADPSGVELDAFLDYRPAADTFWLVRDIERTENSGLILRARISGSSPTSSRWRLTRASSRSRGHGPETLERPPSTISPSPELYEWWLGPAAAGTWQLGLSWDGSISRMSLEEFQSWQPRWTLRTRGASGRETIELPAAGSAAVLDVGSADAAGSQTELCWGPLPLGQAARYRIQLAGVTAAAVRLQFEPWPAAAFEARSPPATGHPRPGAAADLELLSTANSGCGALVIDLSPLSGRVILQPPVIQPQTP